MASSPVEVCNLALQNIGIGPPIDSLEDAEDKASRVCNSYYDLLRKNLLETRKWRFALRQEFLALSDYDPGPTSWALSYQYPGDCLDFIRLVDTYGIANSDVRSYRDFTGNEDVVIPTRVSSDALLSPEGIGYATYSTRLWEGLSRFDIITPTGRQKVILTNRAEAYGEFIADVKDVAAFDNSFIVALSWYISASICVPLSADLRMQERAVGMYRQMMTQAEVKNANETSDRPEVRPSWLERR